MRSKRWTKLIKKAFCVAQTAPVLGTGRVPKVVAVVGEASDFGVLAVVADANERHPGLFDHRDELLHAAAVFVAAHAVHLE